MLRFLLYPFFKWIYKPDFKRLQECVEVCVKRRGEQDVKIEELLKNNKKYACIESALSRLSDKYQWNYLSKTKHGEVVVISHDRDNLQNFELFLTKISDNPNGTSQVHLETHYWEAEQMIKHLHKVGVDDVSSESMIALCDIMNRERGKGYAQALLSFFVKIASERNLKTIVGWLSPVDKEEHNNLQRFYQSLGFEVYMINNEEGVVIKRL